jgi:hypothetical protein
MIIDTTVIAAYNTEIAIGIMVIVMNERDIAIGFRKWLIDFLFEHSNQKAQHSNYKHRHRDIGFSHLIFGLQSTISVS